MPESDTPAEGTRHADAMDHLIRKVESVAHDIDDAEMEDNLRQAAWRMREVAEWDRKENGPTPTDKLAEFVSGESDA